MRSKINFFGVLLVFSDETLVIKRPSWHRHITIPLKIRPGRHSLDPHVTDEEEGWWRRLARLYPSKLQAFGQRFGEELAARWRAHCTPTTIDMLIAEGWDILWFEETDLTAVVASLKDGNGTYRVNEESFEQLAGCARRTPCDVLRMIEAPIPNLLGLVRERAGKLEQLWLADYRATEGSLFTVAVDWLPPEVVDEMVQKHAPRLMSVIARARWLINRPRR